jgi:hypothetical protein
MKYGARRSPLAALPEIALEFPVDRRELTGDIPIDRKLGAGIALRHVYNRLMKSRFSEPGTIKSVVFGSILYRKQPRETRQFQAT